MSDMYRANDMDITLSAGATMIVTALLVGFILLAIQLAVNRYSLRQQKLQWEEEDREAEREEREAEKERELELSNQLQEIYGNAISSLTVLLTYDEQTQLDKLNE